MLFKELHPEKAYESICIKFFPNLIFFRFVQSAKLFAPISEILSGKSTLSRLLQPENTPSLT